MPRTPTLRYDRGTLILHPPPKGDAWARFVTWDDRVEKFRLPALHYRSFLEAMQQADIQVEDKAKGFSQLTLTPNFPYSPYPHQQEALSAWKAAGRCGVVVLPTGAGKTFLAQLAIASTPRSTLITVPTLDLMQQWYADLEAAFPNTPVGLLGGGSKDDTPILVATYDSAAIYAETLGNRYGLIIFDECHHLPSSFTRVIAEYSLAPYRLGLSATPERSDGKDQDLTTLIGPTVYRRRPEELAGDTLAEHKVIQIRVSLTDDERKRYDQLISERNTFLDESGIRLGSLQGWQRFVAASARSKAGRAAMLAHRDARALAFGTEGKLRVLTELLAKHSDDRVLIFTDDNAMVYRVSSNLLIPAITHQTPVKERHDNLQRFRDGTYQRVVTSRVLNEGVDVPEASIAIVLSGTSTTREYVQRLGRILRKGEGKLALLYEVIAEDTSEEGTARRRRGEPASISNKPTPPQQPQISQKRLRTIADAPPINFEDL